jgi:hypothetical protein
LSVLQLIEKSAPITSVQVERMLTHAGDRYLILLLTETSKAVPKVKPGIPALAHRVLDGLTEEHGPLDEALTNFIKQRPRALYQRLLIDRNDAKTMTMLGVCWLPQVRLVRAGRVLFRSSVSVGDNGQFLAQDVGGRSFIRRSPVPASGFINLVDALSAEIDRTRTR